LPGPIIALTTDFGWGSSYVAQLKAVFLGSVPEARLVDVSHSVPAQSVLHGEILLRSIAFIYGPGSVHVVVIDPGVGTQRLPIAVEARGCFFVGPDNGLFGQLKTVPGSRAVVLDKPEIFRHPVSNTFHGRDIFAPVAAELASGLVLDDVGTPIESWATGTLDTPMQRNGLFDVPLLAADHFGNILTHLHARQIPENPRIYLNKNDISLVATYGDATDGSLVALIGSDGYLELAVKNGSAAEALGANWQTCQLSVSSKR
jgi:S-adenosylmethionine hydrolase